LIIDFVDNHKQYTINSFKVTEKVKINEKMA